MLNAAAHRKSPARPRIRETISSLKVVDALYCMYLFAVVLMSTLGMGANDVAYIATVAVGSVFAVARLLTTRFEPRFFLLAMLLAFLGFVEFAVSRRFTVLLTALLLVGAKEMKPRELLGTFLAAKIIGLILVVLFVVIGVYEVEFYQYYKMATGSYIQRVLVNGSSTNVMHLSFLAIAFLTFYMKKGRCGLVYYLAFFCLNLLCASITGSYIGLFLGTGGLLLFFACQHSQGFRSLFVKCMPALLPALILFSFGTAFFLDGNAFVAFLDKMFQGRIYYNHYFLTSYPISLFGHGMLTAEGNFDNSFVFVFVAYGAITFLVLFGAMQALVYRLRSSLDWVALAVVAVYMIAGLSESFYPAAAVNPSLLLLVPLLGFFPPEETRKDPSAQRIVSGEQNRGFCRDRD